MPTIMITVLNNVQIVKKLMHAHPTINFLRVDFLQYHDWTGYRMSSSTRIMMIKSSATLIMVITTILRMMK